MEVGERIAELKAGIVVGEFVELEGSLTADRKAVDVTCYRSSFFEVVVDDKDSFGRFGGQGFVAVACT